MKKVILGLSGGVDSSVCISLLKDQGYDVSCMFMRNWDSTLNNDILGNPDINASICPQEQDYNDAKLVCKKENVMLYRVDFIKEYWDNVFNYFITEYKKGRTPNPDIMCNKYIKFDSFLKEAKKIGCDYIAMGHYAKVEHHKDYSLLKKAKDQNKDQTYFLCMLNQEQIRSVLFPLGDINKEEVRKIALNRDLITAKKKDSTGICFIGERNFKEFLKNYIPSKPGDIKTMDNKIVGKHDGLMYYTIGQRKGLNIGGIKEFKQDAWFVCGKDLETNTLYVAQGHESNLLLSNSCLCEDLNTIYYPILEDKEYTAKFRYRQADIKIKIKYNKKNEIFVYYNNVRAVTPGQILCIYDNDICMGGAIIKDVYYNDEKRKY